MSYDFCRIAEQERNKSKSSITEDGKSNKYPLYLI